MGMGGPLDWPMGPCIDRLVSCSPRAPSSSALVGTPAPNVATVLVAGLVTTGLSGMPTPVGAGVPTNALEAAAFGAAEVCVSYQQVVSA